jgi:hypothetical protein
MCPVKTVAGQDGLRYLQAWQSAWNDPRLREWIAAVSERRLPEQR